jgi:hypothetical protein
MKLNKKKDSLKRKKQRKIQQSETPFQWIMYKSLGCESSYKAVSRKYDNKIKNLILYNKIKQKNINWKGKNKEKYNKAKHYSN